MKIKRKEWKYLFDECKIMRLLMHYAEKQFLGVSPDGLINNETIVEVKCPYSAAQWKMQLKIKL